MTETVLHSFNNSGLIGADNLICPIIYQNGIIYGTNAIGFIYSYNTISNQYNTLYNFNNANIYSIVYYNGLLYGTTYNIGTNNVGTIYSYNITSNQLNTLYSFTGGTNGESPINSFNGHYNGILYGTTTLGGANNLGTLYSYNITSNQYNTLYSFTGGNSGKNPTSYVIYDNGILYGTTPNGGNNNIGLLYSYNIITNQYNILYSFNGTITGFGTNDTASVTLNNGILYGTTFFGGNNNKGELYSYNITSNQLNTLYSFTGTGTNGANPCFCPIYQNGILYGTTYTGGSNNVGTIYSYNITSNQYNTLYSFTGGTTDGANPYISVLYQNGILYGNTNAGGSNSIGTLYSYKLPPTPTPTPTPTPNPNPNPNPIPISNICFPKGTLILTDQGEIPIDEIIPLKNTIHNKRITAITKTISQYNYLVCFYKNALGYNYPNKDTLISKDHKIFYKEKFIKAYKFVNHFEKVEKVDYNKEILYNVLMETYEKINVNNIICETLHPNNIIAQLYNSTISKELKNKIIFQMNESINKNDNESFINVCESFHPNNIIAKICNSKLREKSKNKIIYGMNKGINK